MRRPFHFPFVVLLLRVMLGLLLKLGSTYFALLLFCRRLLLLFFVGSYMFCIVSVYFFSSFLSIFFMGYSTSRSLTLSFEIFSLSPHLILHMIFTQSPSILFYLYFPSLPSIIPLGSLFLFNQYLKEKYTLVVCLGFIFSNRVKWRENTNSWGEQVHTI